MHHCSDHPLCCCFLRFLSIHASRQWIPSLTLFALTAVPAGTLTGGPYMRDIFFGGDARSWPLLCILCPFILLKYTNGTHSSHHIGALIPVRFWHRQQNWDHRPEKHQAESGPWRNRELDMMQNIVFSGVAAVLLKQRDFVYSWRFWNKIRGHSNFDACRHSRALEGKEYNETWLFFERLLFYYLVYWCNTPNRCWQASTRVIFW